MWSWESLACQRFIAPQFLISNENDFHIRSDCNFVHAMKKKGEKKTAELGCPPFFVLQWRLFIFISRESKWGTLKSAGNPRCAVPAESRSIYTDRRRPGPAAALQVSPTSDTCQSVAILMNRPHWSPPLISTLKTVSAAVIKFCNHCGPRVSNFSLDVLKWKCCFNQIRKSCKTNIEDLCVVSTVSSETKNYQPVLCSCEFSAAGHSPKEFFAKCLDFWCTGGTRDWWTPSHVFTYGGHLGGN